MILELLARLVYKYSEFCFHNFRSFIDDDVREVLNRLLYNISPTEEQYCILIKDLNEKNNEEWIEWFIDERRGQFIIYQLWNEQVSTNELWYDIFFNAINNNYLDLVRQFLIDGRIDPSWNRNYAITLAVKTSASNEIVNLLLSDPRVNPNENYCLVEATQNEDSRMVSILMNNPNLDITTYNMSCFLSARHGYLDIINILLHPKMKIIDPGVLQLAVYYNHLEVVKALLKDERVSKTDPVALDFAVDRGNDEIIQLLSTIE